MEHRQDLNSELYRLTRVTWDNQWAKTPFEAELASLSYPHVVEEMEVWLPFLPMHGVILEAGCGVGHKVFELRRRDYKVVGVDYALEGLRRGKLFDCSLPLIQADIHHLPFRNNSIEAYLSFGVLEHIEWGLLPALREAHRILRPGGVLVITLPYPNVVAAVRERLVQINRKIRRRKRYYFETRYSPQEVSDYLVQSGFTVLDMKLIGHAFTLWGLNLVFRYQGGYYKPSRVAYLVAGLVRGVAPQLLAHMSLTIARKEVT